MPQAGGPSRSSSKRLVRSEALHRHKTAFGYKAHAKSVVSSPALSLLDLHDVGFLCRPPSAIHAPGGRRGTWNLDWLRSGLAPAALEADKPHGS